MDLLVMLDGTLARKLFVAGRSPPKAGDIARVTDKAKRQKPVLVDVVETKSHVGGGVIYICKTRRTPERAQRRRAMALSLCSILLASCEGGLLEVVPHDAGADADAADGADPS